MGIVQSKNQYAKSIKCLASVKAQQILTAESAIVPVIDGRLGKGLDGTWFCFPGSWIGQVDPPAA
jgi:hypothetical protein